MKIGGVQEGLRRIPDDLRNSQRGGRAGAGRRRREVDSAQAGPGARGGTSSACQFLGVSADPQTQT